MSFLNRLVHTATSKRLTVSGNKEVYTANLTGEPCLVQPLSESAAQQSGLNFGKAFRCYMQSTADIEEHDEVTIDSVVYKVHGVKLHDYGQTPHLRVLLESRT